MVKAGDVWDIQVLIYYGTVTARNQILDDKKATLQSADEKLSIEHRVCHVTPVRGREGESP